MKHYIISEEQLQKLNTMLFESEKDSIGLQKLPELKRLSDEEIDAAVRDNHCKTNRQLAHAIMDKLGVPE
jgi:hypothetical protein